MLRGEATQADRGTVWVRLEPPAPHSTGDSASLSQEEDRSGAQDPGGGQGKRGC